VGRRDALGGAVSGPEDPSSRSPNRGDSPHHRVQPRRHRGHLDRRRALARHLGRRRERFEASRSSNGRGPGEARDAARSERVGARVRWRRSVLLRRRKEREGESRPPAQARLGRGSGFELLAARDVARPAGFEPTTPWFTQAAYTSAGGKEEPTTPRDPHPRIITPSVYRSAGSRRSTRKKRDSELRYQICVRRWRWRGNSPWILILSTSSPLEFKTGRSVS